MFNKQVNKFQLSEIQTGKWNYLTENNVRNMSEH